MKSGNKVFGPVCIIIEVQAGQHWMQAGPETLFSDFIAAGNFQFVKALKEFYDGFHNPITNVATSEDKIVTECDLKNIYNK